MRRRFTVAFVLAGLMLAAVAPAAIAHEEAKAGPLDFEFGFGTEPAYAGVPNSAQLLISRDGKPVTDLGKSIGKMSFHVLYGLTDAQIAELTKDPGKIFDATPKSNQGALTLEPYFGDDWGTPGDYRAFFTPSQPGDYTFHLDGEIKGTPINLAFTSADGGFGAAQDPIDKAVPAVDTPTAAELNTRADREAARTAALITDARNDANAAASQARLFAWLAVGLGLVALALAVVALRRHGGGRTARSEDTLRHPTRVA